MAGEPLDEDWRVALRRRLVAEAERRLAAGERLYEGQWVGAEERRRLVRAVRRRRWLRAVELILLWAGVGLVGLLLIALTAALA